MGHPTEIFVSTPSEEIICAICLDVMKDPVQVGCRGDHAFCAGCVKTFRKRQGTTCPTCQQSVESFKPAALVQRIINDQEVRCIRNTAGCKWQGKLGSMEHHLQKDCQFVGVKCGHCGEKMTRNKVENHRATTCELVPLPCPHGSQLCGVHRRRDLARHLEACTNIPCQYKPQGCPYRATKVQIEQHVKEYCGRLHDQIGTLQKIVQDLHCQKGAVAVPAPTPTPAAGLASASHAGSSSPSACVEDDLHTFFPPKFSTDPSAATRHIYALLFPRTSNPIESNKELLKKLHALSTSHKLNWEQRTHATTVFAMRRLQLEKQRERGRQALDAHVDPSEKLSTGEEELRAARRLASDKHQELERIEHELKIVNHELERQKAAEEGQDGQGEAGALKPVVAPIAGPAEARSVKKEPDEDDADVQGKGKKRALPPPDNDELPPLQEIPNDEENVWLPQDRNAPEGSSSAKKRARFADPIVHREQEPAAGNPVPTRMRMGDVLRTRLM